MRLAAAGKCASVAELADPAAPGTPGQLPAASGVALGAASSPALMAPRSIPTLGEGSLGIGPGFGASWNE